MMYANVKKYLGKKYGILKNNFTGNQKFTSLASRKKIYYEIIYTYIQQYLKKYFKKTLNIVKRRFYFKLNYFNSWVNYSSLFCSLNFKVVRFFP